MHVGSDHDQKRADTGPGRARVGSCSGGQSMQTYLLGELERIVGFPTNQELIRQIEERLEASDTIVSASEILNARDKDRK